MIRIFTVFSQLYKIFLSDRQWLEQAEVLRDKEIIEERLKKEQGRYETLLDMRMNNEIPKEVFSRKQQAFPQKHGFPSNPSFRGVVSYL